MEKTEVVAKIIEYVGGKDNVVNTWHCMTRLRFELKDTSKIQEDTIKALRKDAPWVKVMVGGAVLTQEYADAIGADAYCKDAMASVNFATSVIGEA